MRKIIVTYHGQGEDPNASWHETIECVSVTGIKDGGWRFKLANGNVRTIPGDNIDIEEMLPDGRLGLVTR